MIAYFIKLSHTYKTPNNYSATLIKLQNDHSYGKWTSQSENVLFHNVIDKLPILTNYSLASQILECVKEHSYLQIGYNFRPTNDIYFTYKPYCI